MSVYSSVVTRGGVTVTVTINLEHPYADEPELGEATGIAAARLAKQTTDAMNRADPF